MTDLLLALDCGTTSTRALAFDTSGTVVASAQRPLAVERPRPGWAEQSAAALAQRSREVLGECLAALPETAEPLPLGIANQRETLVAWSASSGRPLCPAISWQDRRTAADLDERRAAGEEEAIARSTGLVLDSYFTAPKMAWALAHAADVRAAAASGDLRMGTVDSWLAWTLSRGRLHVTDTTNASRTMLMDLVAGAWSEGLLASFGVPAASLAAIVPSAGALGEVVVGGRRLLLAGLAGDQQAAALGQACLRPGSVKCTYGTGLFLIAPAGERAPTSGHGLVITWLPNAGSAPAYALEGSLFVAGAAVQWLRDGMRLFARSADTEALARGLGDDEDELIFVPAFAGLGAPHWTGGTRGLITGITPATGPAHLARAALRAMGDQTADLVEALAGDGLPPARLRVDGGMTANRWMCQDIADACGIPVDRALQPEATAVGAAMLAGTGAGLFAGLEEAAAAMAGPWETFEPRGGADRRNARRERWARAIRQVLAGV